MATRRAPRVSDAALVKFEAEFGKQFGADTIRRNGTVGKYEVIPTGSIALDYVLGVGGYVEGRMTEIWGADGTGKTTLALIAIAQAQRKYRDRMATFIDVETKLDREWAKKLGVDLSRMYHVVPESAEDVADIVKSMLQSKLISFIVLDSIGAMTAAEEVEKDADERSVGTTPSVITRMVRIAAMLLPPARCHLLIINQVRANLGYGADTTTGGGFALKHATTHRIKARKALGKPIQVGSGNEAVQVGFQVALRVEKNQVASPGRTAIVTLVNQPTEKYGMNYGIADLAGEAFAVGKRAGLFIRTKGQYTMPDGQTAASEEKALELLRADPKMVTEVRRQIVTMIASGEMTGPEAGGEEESADEHDYTDVVERAGDDEAPLVNLAAKVETPEAIEGMDV